MRVLIVGEDSTAYFLARRLRDAGHSLTLVARDRDRARTLARSLDVPVLQGEGARADVLDDAGALRSDVLVALTERDHDNLVCCQVARRVFSVPRTVAVVNDPSNRDVFHRLGVDEVVSVTEILAGAIGQTALFQQIAELVPVAQGELLVSEVLLTDESPGAGRTLGELRAGRAGLVAAVIRGGEVLIPDGRTRLEASDRLLVIAKPGERNRLLQALLGSAG